MNIIVVNLERIGVPYAVMRSWSFELQDYLQFRHLR